MIKITTIGDSTFIPCYATEGSAGLDLCASEDYLIHANDQTLISTGIKLALEPSTVGLICPRSGLALKQGITVLNAPGIIDSDYRGEIKVLIWNTRSDWYRIAKGDRIAQLLVMPILKPQLTLISEEDWDTETTTKRGIGGFGSTGVAQLEVVA